MAALVCGDKVKVGGNIGVVQFVGNVHYANGTFVGVELDTPQGKNDGAVKGTRYFSCKPGHGVFRRVSDVQLLEAVKFSTSDADKTAALEHKESGNTYFKQSNYTQAIEEYSRAIELDPRNNVFLLNRAACYLELEKPDEALVDAETSIAIDGNWWKAYFRKGKALEMIEEYEKAAQAFGIGALRAQEDGNLEAERTKLLNLQQQMLEREAQFQTESAQMNQIPGMPPMGSMSGLPPMGSMSGLPPMTAENDFAEMQQMFQNPEFLQVMQSDPEFQALCAENPGFLESLTSNNAPMQSPMQSPAIPEESFAPVSNAPPSASKTRLQKPVLRVLAIQEAVKLGDIAEVEKAIEEELSVGNKDAINEVDDHGLSPLAWACKKDNQSIVSLLISKGACVNPRLIVEGGVDGSRIIKAGEENDEENEEEDDVIPVQEAAHKGHLEILKLLVENNANIMARDPILGHTCMHRAIDANKPEIIQYLAAQNKELINALDFRKLSPLGMACAKQNVEVAALLVEMGANPNEPSSLMSCLSQIEKVLRKNNEPVAIELATLLLDNGATPGLYEVYTLAKQNNKRIMELLSKASAVPLKEVCGDNGETILHVFAKKKGNAQVLQSIKDLGLVNLSTNNEGQTSLFVAAEKGDDTIAGLLVEECGVDMQVQDNNGNSALHIAGKAANRAVWEYLESKGANSSLKNNEGECPELKENPADKCCIM